MPIDDAILERLPAGISLAELHGTVAGLLCATATDPAGADSFLRDLADLLGLGADEIDADLADFVAETAAALDSPDLSFDLALTGDEAPVTERLTSLAEWCAAFLAAIERAEAVLDDECEEALADLEAIAAIAVDDDDADEAFEQEFTEVTEHARVAVMLLRAATRADEDGAG